MQPGCLFPIAALLAVGAMVAPAPAATITIVMEKLTISPATATAKVGDTVEWVNRDAFVHSATANNGDFDVRLPAGRTVASVLGKAGSVDYYCRFHPNMKATLTIAP
jgi:plastocyanin